MTRPALYIDVDGPLNPYVSDSRHTPAGFTAHRMKPESWVVQHPGKPRSSVEPLRVLLNPDHGPRLAAFEDVFELVWATAWGKDANEFIAPVLGLPQLAVITWPDVPDYRAGGAAAQRTPGPGGEFWKTVHLVAHAAGRPFVWLDDEITDLDEAYVRTHHGGLALLHRVDRERGLQDGDFEAVAGFAAALAGR
ncbi:hypothetical protein [Streptodolium elevatio]|uniref:Secreted protein n=1 Tax=Streptodolium elevatio TaxID=3157996 RepID=A0ABV3DCK3_9ACTN